MSRGEGRNREGGDSHQEYDELAVGWALEALEPDDEARLRRHMAECNRCRQTVDDAREVAAALALALPAEQPSEALRDRILSAAAAEPRPVVAAVSDQPAGRALERRTRPEPATARTVQRTRRGRPLQARHLTRGLALVAALALVVGLGAWNLTLRTQQSQVQATAAQQAAVLDELDDRGIYRVAPLEDPDGQSVGTVYIHDGVAKVMSNGLPVNDTSTETLVLWGMRPSATPVALGTFDVVGPDLDVRTVSSRSTGLDQYDGYAVSLEPGSQAPSIPTEMVATGTVGS